MTIDLRSDTVTRPTAAMRAAMAQAEVGDDVYGEDPSINRLEGLGAEMLGKEAALFVPSGTMGNLISLMAHAGRGTEVILGDESHIYHYEQGGASTLASLVFHPLPTQADGTLTLEDLARSIRDRDDEHCAWPGVVCLENTHNRRGGKVLSPDYCLQVRTWADSEDLPLHLDGARLANAAVALNTDLATLAAPFHSVQLDLSKGLGAPVGGLVVGSRPFIGLARRMRKMLGGGMRQAGVLAAAGIVALTQMLQRLREDHQQAAWLAAQLAELAEVEIDPGSVHTNLVIFRLRKHEPAAFVRAMAAEGVLLGDIGNRNLRMVTHYDLTPAQLQRALAVTKQVLLTLSP